MLPCLVTESVATSMQLGEKSNTSPYAACIRPIVDLMAIWEYAAVEHYSKEATIMKLLAMAATVAFLVWSTIPAQAHSGGTNSSGCHHNHKTGGYHCHNPK